MNQSLYDFLRTHCKTHEVRSYLEIGTRDGDSLRVVAEAAKSLNRVVCCDTWGNEYGGSGRGSATHIQNMLSAVGYSGALTCLTGDSKATVPALTETFDLVLVDGDHSYAGGMADLVNTWPLVASGGCVAFHDITHPAHMDLLHCFSEFVASRETLGWRTIVEPYGVGVVFKP